MNPLLNKYYDGNTSLTEEQQLRQAHADDLIDALADYRDAPVDVPAGLEQALSESIDRWERQEKVKSRSRRGWLMAAGIAASVAALVAVFLTVNRPSPIVTPPPVVAVNTPAHTVTPPATTQEEEPTQVVESPLLAMSEAPATPHHERHAARKHSAPRHEPRHEPQQAVAQAAATPTAEVLTPEEEAATLRALELFAATVSKGRETIGNAGSSLASVQNTIIQLLD